MMMPPVNSGDKSLPFVEAKGPYQQYPVSSAPALDERKVPDPVDSVRRYLNANGTAGISNPAIGGMLSGFALVYIEKTTWSIQYNFFSPQLFSLLFDNTYLWLKVLCCQRVRNFF